MGMSGIGSAVSSLGTQYDFTKMTNKQFMTTVQELGSEGKIPEADAAQLSYIAQGVDYVPIHGSGPTVQETLADPAQHDFIKELQGDDYGANQPGSVGGALYDSMLKDLQTYQATALEQPTPNLSVEA